MRVRSRNSKPRKVTGCHPTYSPGTTPTCSVVDQAEVCDMRELIYDHNNGKLRPSSRCWHWKASLQPFPVNCTGATQYSYRWAYVDAQLWGVPSNLPAAFPMPNMEQLKREALVKLRDEYGSMVEDLSLVNNLLEIGELPDLIRNVLNSAQRAAREVRFSNKPSKGARGAIGKAYRAKDSAGGQYLSYEFGVEPFARDLAALYQNLQSLIGKLRSAGNGTTTPPRRFNMRMKNVYTYMDPVEFSNHSLAYAMPRIEYTVRLTGTIQVRVPPIDDLYDGLKLAADTIGFHLDPRVLYDAIPFSWMLDWILPIGNWLDQMDDRRWIKPVVTLRNASVSASSRHNTLIRVDRPYGFPPDGNADVGLLFTELYFREPLDGEISSWVGIPTAPEFQLPKLDLNKLAILAGLADVI